MKGSLIVIACFAAGIIAGAIVRANPAWLGDASLWLLYLLMFQVGAGVGADPRIKGMLRSVGFTDLLLPVAAVGGTLLLTLAVAPFIRSISLTDSLAVNSACGYYSLSSILIPQLKAASVGAADAARLGTVALLANVIRELIALTGARTIVRRFGPHAAIAAAGVTSVDVCLPALRRWCGERYVATAIVNGTLTDICTPWMIAFFCSI